MPRLMLLATSLGFGVVQLDVSVVNVAVKPIGDDLGASVAGLQWVVNAYTITFAAFILAAGAVGDRVGARRTFMAGFALFTAASAACGLAPSLGVLVAARAVQGLGAAVLVPCSLALITHAYADPEARGRAVGVWAAGASVALALGPLIGGALSDAVSWRAIFFVNAPLGLAALAITARLGEETPRGTRRVPARGEALAIVRHPSVTMGVLLNVAVYGLLFVFSLFFQRTQGRSTLATGFAFLPMAVTVGVANVLSPRIPRAMAIGAAGTFLACAALLATGPGTPYAAVAPQFVLLGFGVGLIVPAMTSALLGAVAAGRAGVASGTLNTARQAGSAIGVGLFGALGDLRACLAVSAGIGLALLGLTRRAT